MAAVWLLAATLPLAAAPAVADPLTPIRLVVLGAAVFLGLWTATRSSLDRTTLVALGIGLATFVAAALLGRTPLLSMIGRFQRFEGVPVLALYAGALWLGARLLSADQRRLRQHFVDALSVATLVLFLAAMAQAVSNPGQRVTAILGNASIVGLWGLLAVGMLGWAAFGRRSPLWLAGAGAGLGLVCLSASRGALLGLIAAMVAALVVGHWTTRRPPWWLPVTVVAVGALAGAALPLTRSRISGASPFAEATVSGRWLLWADSVRLLRDHPMFGVGPSRFVDEIGRYHTAAWAEVVGPYAPPDSPHSSVLQVLCATGVVGMASVLLILAALSRAARAATPERLELWMAGSLTALTGVGVASLTHFTDPVTVPVLLALLGGSVGRWVAANRPRRLGAATATRRTAAGLALVAALALGGTGLMAERALWQGLQEPDPERRVQALVHASTLRPWDPDLARRAGFALTARAIPGEPGAAEAVSLLRSACPRLPGSVECLHTLADALDANRDPAASLAVLDQAQRFDPFNVDTLLRRGVTLAQIDRRVEAEAAFLAAARLRPAAPEPWENLGILYRSSGRPTEAEQAEATAERLRTR